MFPLQGSQSWDAKGWMTENSYCVYFVHFYGCWKQEGKFDIGYTIVAEAGARSHFSVINKDKMADSSQA